MVAERSRAARIRLFSADAKDEIARVPFRRDCCPRAFLAAFSVLGKATSGDAGADLFGVRASRGAIARAVLRAAAQAGVAGHARQSAARRSREPHAIDVVFAHPLASASGVPSRGCCRQAWIRAAFLACGSVADPVRGYHLEFNARNDADARAVTAGLAALDVDAGISRRRGKTIAYVKGGQAVADLLAQMGAVHAVLWLDEVRARRETKNAIRRTVNSEAANAARAGTAGARQLKAAKVLLHPARKRVLSPALREAAVLRAAHPDMTLNELSRLARPNVTKSTMGYRLREIERLARGLGRLKPAPS